MSDDVGTDSATGGQHYNSTVILQHSVMTVQQYTTLLQYSTAVL